ncbi:MAG: alpha/beta fold hydrolase [Desulfobacterales bacterium]|nr:alpha/beta fold hydrolase [Deltaproteobacteria bacterium]MBT8362424.1 alpha/beta fold hydrolase [Deltaproteobacteria bacterium]NNK96595.1 alpha/beta fold hydrolase [Desulfobacterales bacterium]
MKILANKWILLVALALLLPGFWFVYTHSYYEEEKELRSQLRETVKNAFPEPTARFSQSVGLFPFNENSQITGITRGHSTSVILVHGLDDPGKVWQNLAPKLLKQGHTVWILQYPNDQPVVESSLLFFEELRQLRQLGVDMISIVGHSMGGLVSRELLTSPEIAYDYSTETGLVPKVELLIMVGTPNHGTHLARFRVFAELKDHFVRLSKGEFNWLGSILDGAGEAKIDLLPDSRFLTELNSRPHPERVDMQVIAGITSPWSENDIDSVLGHVQQKITPLEQTDIAEIRRYLVSMTHGLGDGLVSVESTRLKGVPHLTVSGTHLSMIRNITETSDRVPPAIPVILDKLSKAK